MLGLRTTFLGAVVIWLDNGTADWFWPAAAKAGLPVMFLAPGRFANMVPVVDHMGINFLDSRRRNQRYAEAGKISERFRQALGILFQGTLPLSQHQSVN